MVTITSYRFDLLIIIYSSLGIFSSLLLFGERAHPLAVSKAVALSAFLVVEIWGDPSSFLSACYSVAKSQTSLKQHLIKEVLSTLVLIWKNVRINRVSFYILVSRYYLWSLLVPWEEPDIEFSFSEDAKNNYVTQRLLLKKDINVVQVIQSMKNFFLGRIGSNVLCVSHFFVQSCKE